MKKLFLFSVAILATLILSGCGNQAQVIADDIAPVVSDECINLCQQVSSVCSTAISQEQCQKACPNWSQETKEKIGGVSGCQDVAQVPELGLAVLPEMNTPELAPASNNCEAACGGYVTKCLSLVPNATQALYNEGMISCMDECKEWDTTKTECMISAVDCPAMTDVCGL